MLLMGIKGHMVPNIFLGYLVNLSTNNKTKMFFLLHKEKQNFFPFHTKAK